jgi:hypothetical protein
VTEYRGAEPEQLEQSLRRRGAAPEESGDAVYPVICKAARQRRADSAQTTRIVSSIWCHHSPIRPVVSL